MKKRSRKRKSATRVGSGRRRRVSAARKPRAAARKRKAVRKAVVTRRGGKRAKARRTVAASIRADHEAVREVGAENVRAGTRSLGSTNWLTPTGHIGGKGGGFGALNEALSEIKRLPRNVALFSYNLRVRWVNPDGTPTERVFAGIGVPIDVKSRRNLQFKVTSQIHDAIMREILPGIARAGGGATPTPGEVELIGADRVRAHVREMKAQRKLRFQVEFFRDEA